jgi:hypothetical protein
MGGEACAACAKRETRAKTLKVKDDTVRLSKGPTETLKECRMSARLAAERCS